jgi:PPOX class probable F420-dependent enzyme
MKIPDAVRTVVDTAPFAHLTTLNADGGPQVTIVWVDVEGDEFVIGHMGERRKTRNVRQDSRVALSMLATTMSPIGLREYVVVYGRARVTEGGAVALLQKLARRYLGPNAEFPPPQFRDQPGFITRITPERFGGVGVWSPAKH